MICSHAVLCFRVTVPGCYEISLVRGSQPNIQVENDANPECQFVMQEVGQFDVVETSFGGELFFPSHYKA